MIWTLLRDLAFGRSGGVGIDGSLTGLFLIFHCFLGYSSGGEEDLGTKSLAWKFLNPGQTGARS